MARSRASALGLADLPFIVVLVGLAGAAMVMPAVYAAATGDWRLAGIFGFSSGLTLVFFGIVAIATQGRRVRRQGRGHLISLITAYVALPFLLALPFVEAVPGAGFLDAWIEMMSCLTTTGATFFEPDALPYTLHLWRAWVAWLGGFFVWVTAVAIFAPLNLGGYEIGSEEEVGRGAVGSQTAADPNTGPERLRKFAARLAPIYALLTGVLWISLILAGDQPRTAAIHAMATLSTSGITESGALETGPSGVGRGAGLGGEAIILVFLVFALSRLTFATGEGPSGRLREDPELRLGLFFCLVIPTLMFLRHWIFAVESSGVGVGEGIVGFWGAAFTTVSFLTTTGFVSTAWGSAQAWSGLSTPGLILIGLALMGGGVATTAGGIKLLRIYALYRHGVREMEKLVRPSSVAGAGRVARRFRGKGAYVAWIFFMLFALSLAAVSILYTLLGQDFDSALVLTVSALTTTGPLLDVALPEPVRLLDLADAGKVLFGAAMIVGRLELLVIIAVLNPDFWRS